MRLKKKEKKSWLSITTGDTQCLLMVLYLSFQAVINTFLTLC